ncbi:MAG: hypothetical protein HY316_01130 [Acidobacteria bacterium]|nr:hypothetical protein [Acidobacteriota bacterium]
MKQTACPQELAVARAARTGHWEESLRVHAAECTLCRQVAATSRWMRALANAPEANHSLPDPSLLWWEAQVAERQAQAERTQKPLEWAAVFAEAILIAGPAGCFAWYWQDIERILMQSLLAAVPQIWNAAWTAANWGSALFSG